MYVQRTEIKRQAPSNCLMPEGDEGKVGKKRAEGKIEKGPKQRESLCFTMNALRTASGTQRVAY